MTELVGYTGFVGSNIYSAAGDAIQNVYNSKNIADAYGSEPDLLIYSGLRAEKYLANNAPQKDMELVKEAEKIIERINPKKLVLISTIDVFKTPKGVDEETKIDTNGLHPYGYNRYQLELWVREHYPDALIIRLPGLFGKNIKKNFIYDFIYRIPFMLSKQKMEKLLEQDGDLKKYYILQENSFFKVKELTEDERLLLKSKFKLLGFSALNFTDSRSRYQFYDLKRLWKDICVILEHGITLWHPATEPVSAGEVYEFLTGKKFVNELNDNPIDYDFKTVHGELFEGSNGYISSKDEVLDLIKEFVGEN